MHMHRTKNSLLAILLRYFRTYTFLLLVLFHIFYAGYAFFSRPGQDCSARCDGMLLNGLFAVWLRPGSLWWYLGK
jgi:hypothetical protein